MKRTFVSLSIVCMILTIMSCGTTRNTAGSISSLEGEWNISEINGTTVLGSAGQEMPYIGFNTLTGNVHGNSGCNRMMGSFDIYAKAGTLDLSSLASTRMMCNDMTTENNVLNTLKNVKGYQVMSGSRIALLNSSGRPVMLLDRRGNISTPELTVLDGEWKIVEVEGSIIPSDMDKQPFISFDSAQKRIHGNAGCNQMNGGYATDSNNDRAISFPGVAVTMMACPDMTIERKVMDALNKTKSFSVISDKSVALNDEAGNMLMMIMRR